MKKELTAWHLDPVGLYPMAKEDSIISMLSKMDQLKFLALTAQIPRVHKLHWKDDKISRDWLARISTLNSSAVAVKSMSTADDVKAWKEITPGKSERHSSLDNLPRSFIAEPVELKSRPEESFHDQELRDEQCQSRTPDSTYISLISQIDLPFSFSKISKKSYSEENFIATNLMPEMKCVYDEELSSPPVLFTSQVNLEAKRKLSFEYIQEVSKLGCHLSDPSL